MAGAPTKYKAAYNKQAYKLSLLGATDDELADFFEVHRDTLYEWKNVHKQFSDSIKKGKLLADSNVVDSLYKRANGYEYTETTFEVVDSKEVLEVTSEAEIVKAPAYKKRVVKKQQAADITAAIFWLKNRQPKNWRDKIEHVNTNVNYNTIPVSKEEAKQIAHDLEEEF